MSWKAHHIGTPGVLAELTAFTSYIILVSGRTNVDLVPGLGCDRVIKRLVRWDNHDHRTNSQGFEFVGMVQTIGGKIHSKTIVVGVFNLGVILFDFVLVGIGEALFSFVSFYQAFELPPVDPVPGTGQVPGLIVTPECGVVQGFDLGYKLLETLPPELFRYFFPMHGQVSVLSVTSPVI